MLHCKLKRIVYFLFLGKKIIYFLTIYLLGLNNIFPPFICGSFDLPPCKNFFLRSPIPLEDFLILNPNGISMCKSDDLAHRFCKLFFKLFFVYTCIMNLEPIIKKNKVKFHETFSQTQNIHFSSSSCFFTNPNIQTFMPQS